ncbi:MAG: hypothetical protein DRJ40_01410 [Thermoprotei archaeon]|nr:MAG: hypothetical protein DRJ40_01410 [Thermoprotei archaeon]
MLWSKIFVIEVNLGSYRTATVWWSYRKLLAYIPPVPHNYFTSILSSFCKFVSKRATVLSREEYEGEVTPIFTVIKLLQVLYAEPGRIDLVHYVRKFIYRELLSNFEWRVLTIVDSIPPGKVTTYSVVAKVLNTSPRVVARVLMRNPWPLVIPCHRVVMSSGFVGGYLGSRDLWWMKAELLRKEGVEVIDGRVMEKYILRDLSTNRIS